MCWVNEWNSRYFVVVRDENCSDLKAAESWTFYGSEVVSSQLLVHALWTGFPALVTRICTVSGIRCEMSARILEVVSCVLWKKICRDFRNLSKEHSVLQGFKLMWNYLEWQISDRLEENNSQMCWNCYWGENLRHTVFMWTTLRKV